MDKIFGDGIKKFVLMGIGAAAMTVEKSQQMVDELVKKGELTVEQGKELNQELKRNVKKTIDEAAEKKEAEEKKEATLEEKIAMMSAEELENLKAFIEKTEASAQSDKAKIDNRERLGEITAVLRKHHITRGVTPGKLRAILEELGPTYVKLGQIMSLHSDVLPQRYCDELMKLTSEVTPMPFETVEEVINRSYREDWHNIFSSIEKETLGSASIAQVHRAKLLDGTDVIVKVERKGIYDIMARDIGLLKRAVNLLPPVGGFKNVVDLEMVLDELWATAQEEMDFLKEAANMEEFARNNQGIR